MKLFVGLGNIGEVYAGTRHNIGWDVVEALAKHLEAPAFTKQPRLHANTTIAYPSPNRRLLLAQPTTYMNLSGQAVQALLQYYKLDTQDLLVIHDDLDFPLGTWKFAINTGDAGHNGIKSIEQSLGTRQFARLRIGIGRPTTPQPIDKYVLERCTPGERTALEQQFPVLLQALQHWEQHGLDSAMRSWNGTRG
jgi:PTH1 family peptidyl-tRNA hydrolase